MAANDRSSIRRAFRGQIGGWIAIGSLLACCFYGSTLFAAKAAKAQDWPTGTPESQGFDSGLLADFVEELRGQGVDSVLVVRNGVLIFDAYFYPYVGDRPHDIASATKSITTTMTGIAIQNGFLNGIEQTIWPLFADEYPDISLVGGKDQIKVLDLLTLSSGLNCGFPPQSDGEALLPMLASDDWIRHVLEYDMRFPPGTQYAYCGPATHLLSAVAVRNTGLDGPEFADQYLFTPLGIDPADWYWPTEQGVTHGWGDLQLHPHAMAKIGQMFLNEGAWDGVQIVSPQWVQDATAPSATYSGIGYIWWLHPPGFDNAYGAAGRAGQHIIVQPYRDLVVVATGSSHTVNPWWSTQLLEARQADVPLPENNAAYQRLLNAIADAVQPPDPIDPVPPLPAIASHVSGNIYRLDHNRFGVQCYSVHFDEDTPAEARVELTLIDVKGNIEELELPMGLDGVPRFTTGKVRGFQVGMVGRWIGLTTFFAQYDALAGVEHLDIGSGFSGDLEEVHIDFVDRTGYFGTQSVTGRLVDGDTCPLNFEGGPVASGDLYVVNDVATGNLLGTTVHWDDRNYFVFGNPIPINLGAAAGVNDMWLSGSVGPTAPGPRPSGPYVGTYYSMTPNVLSLEASGSYVCPNDFDYCGSERLPYEASYVGPVYNLAGSMVGAGPGQLPTSIGGVPVQYTGDGASECTTDGVTTMCTGRVNLNAFKAVNTPPGGASGDPSDSIDVPINAVFTDPTTGEQTPLSLNVTYDAVTSDGYTTVTTSSEASGAIDPNFLLDVQDFATIFFDVSTTAGIAGPIRLCVSYADANNDGTVDGTPAQECDLRLLHNDDDPPDEFVDSTLAASDALCPFDALQTTCEDDRTPEPDDFLCINTVTNQICAGVASLSTFVVLPQNRAPVCDANGPYVVECAGLLTQVTLDGSGSSDPDEDALSYDWSGSFEEGSATGATPTVTFSGTGAFPVSLTVSDDAGASDTCGSIVTVADTVEPVIDCNSPETIAPTDPPISFTATAYDSCSGQRTPMITGYDCYGTNPAGKRVDKTDSCVVEFAGDEVTIVDSGGLLVTIEWTVAVADSTGNVNETTCSLYTAHPVRTCSAARETSAPLWGLVLLLLLAVRIRASARPRSRDVI